MTDNEIIKALELCTTKDDLFVCRECPLLHNPDCSTALKSASLELINRQKAEIERLEKEIEEANIAEEEAEQQALKENKENAELFCKAINHAKTKETNNLLNTGLSIRSYNCLVRAGVTDLAQLSDWTKEDLRHVRNLGQRHFNEVLEVCHSKGIYLKDEKNHDDGSGLLPCPFCGRENVLMHKSEYSGTYYIHCADCQTLFKMDCTAGHDYDKQRLKDNWNRRAKL